MPEDGRGVAGEVVDGARLGGEDLAGGDGALVGLEVARRVGRVEVVVPDEVCVGVLVGVEVEVGVLGEYESYISLLAYVQGRKCGEERNSRVFLVGAVASIEMCHVLPATLYVTFAYTSPGNPSDAPSGSYIEKVIDSSVTSVTFQSR